MAQLSKMEESKYPSVHTMHKRHQSAGKRKVLPVRDQFNATSDLNQNSRPLANRRVQSGVKQRIMQELQQSLQQTIRPQSTQEKHRHSQTKQKGNHASLRAFSPHVQGNLIQNIEHGVDPFQLSNYHSQLDKSSHHKISEVLKQQQQSEKKIQQMKKMNTQTQQRLILE